MEMYILPAGQRDEYLRLYADILRRAGHFDKLLDRFGDTWLGNEDHRKILAFESARAENRDAGCYTVEAALSFCDQNRENLD